jgi:hypothetical protein
MGFETCDLFARIVIGHTTIIEPAPAESDPTTPVYPSKRLATDVPFG